MISQLNGGRDSKKDHKDFGGIQLSPNATNILNIIGLQKLSYENFHLPKFIDFLDLLSVQ